MLINIRKHGLRNISCSWLMIAKLNTLGNLLQWGEVVVSQTARPSGFAVLKFAARKSGSMEFDDLPKRSSRLRYVGVARDPLNPVSNAPSLWTKFSSHSTEEVCETAVVNCWQPWEWKASWTWNSESQTVQKTSKSCFLARLHQDRC